MRIISSTSSSVTCSPILINTCLISAAPTKLFLSKSNALNASRISSSLNLPPGSLTASPPAPGNATGPALLAGGENGASCPGETGTNALLMLLGAALGLSNRHATVMRPTGLFILSWRSRSPSNLPLAIHSIIETLHLPINLSLPTVSLSNTSISISFSLDISKLNSSFHIGFLPPPGLGFVANSWVPIRSFAYGSALPNMP
mmetsp:Transcript_3420/g.8824  ORF Transcript_3420/g.8824 Transcript_3420/m.8824 type:complete len:202 (-) Transcript_3420:368-973(-)